MTATTQELPKNFDFATAESRIYQKWESDGCFNAEPNSGKPPFCIVIPPPNVTGALHLGHALNNTLQDVQVRMKRMQGFEALWMPGTDHAGIATQAVVERRIREDEGKTRHDFTREALVQRIWEWKDEYEARITGQLKQMGCSCDWRRQRFTLDPQCAKAVRFTFFDLFQKSMIYRGKKLVNWDMKLGTAVSSDEIENKEIDGNFWHINYPVIDPKPGEPTHLTVATTRPETMLGDTAVAVHPDPKKQLEKEIAEAERELEAAKEKEKPAIQNRIDNLKDRQENMLAHLELLCAMAKDGRKIRLPLVDREIPIVCDQWAKPGLGSGCVKITPAHDPNDYEVAMRCDLPLINIMDERPQDGNDGGSLNAQTGDYAGMPFRAARKKIVEDLAGLGLLEKVEARKIQLPISDRSKEPIEPFLADQWFVKMDTLAQNAMDAVSDGRVSIYPKRYEGGYISWLSEKRDWPVSRQLWWGHQIPVWSKACDTEAELEELQNKVNELAASTASDTISIQVEKSDPNSKIRGTRNEDLFATIHVCLRDEADPMEEKLESLGLVREEDVLDTWFSSALWPHSTLGWPEKTPELDFFYPGSVLITSRDIITLWVARMVLSGLNNMDDIPFHRVFIHPKILDGYGETMSKSKGNGIDPLDVIRKFGADALRFGMVQMTTETQDNKLPVMFECPSCGESIKQTKKNRTEPTIKCNKCNNTFSTQWARTDEDKANPRGAAISEKFVDAGNFVNKLWNASRFAMMNLDGYSAAPIDDAELETEDRWILSRLATVTQEVTEAYESYKYSEAARTLYNFAWDEFCSFYIEILKARFADEQKRPVAQRMLAHSLDVLLKLLHPAMPFVTEEIWQSFNTYCDKRGLEPAEPSPSIMHAAWPKSDATYINEETESQFALFQQALTALRDIRKQQNIPFKEQMEFVVKCSEDTASVLQPMDPYFERMAKAKSIDMGPNVQPPTPNATLVIGEMEVYVDLKNFIDIDAETKRLEKNIAQLEGKLKGLQGKLGNPGFVNNAAPEVVKRTQNDFDVSTKELELLQQSLKDLQAMN